MKTWKLLLAAMMALVMLFAVSALADGGNAGDAEHGHEWGEWKTVSEPTCEDDGLRYRECKTCDGKEEEVLKATGHDWYTVVAQVEPSCTEVGKTAIEECKNCKAIKGGNEFGEATGHSVTAWDLTKKATCTEAGCYKGDCDNCGETLTEEIPATGHDWKIDQPAVEPTCTENGYTVVKECMVCGYKEGGEVVPATGHSVTTWELEKKATCTEAGSYEGKCDNCGETLTEEIPATGHTYLPDESSIVAATCTEIGKVTYVCAYCGDFYTEEIPAIGHDYKVDESAIVEPTCTQVGKETYVCQNCGDFYTVEIPAIGHDYKVDESAIVEPTCTQVGKETYVCQNCGDFYTVEIPMVEHSWGKWVTIKEATEDEAGLQERTCSVCGATQTREIGTMPETGVATVPTAALVSLMVLAMGSYVVLKKKESC